MDLAQQIIDKLSLPNILLKAPIRGKQGINTKQLITALIYNGSIAEAASYLGYTDNPVKQAIKQLLKPVYQDRSKEFTSISGSKTPWRLLLLSEIGYKYCNSCCSIKEYSSFSKLGVDKVTGLRSICRVCHTLETKDYKLYLLERTPPWADKEKIKEVYISCPEDCHVDHIIPLRGKLVSGLHVHENLQHLKACDNLLKNNKYNVE